VAEAAVVATIVPGAPTATSSAIAADQARRGRIAMWISLSSPCGPDGPPADAHRSTMATGDALGVVCLDRHSFIAEACRRLPSSRRRATARSCQW
jgi:hypothetical protein